MTFMKLLFVDPSCPRPYDADSLRTEGMGGTESATVRVAEALAAHHDVCLQQHNRVAGSVGPSGAVYIGPESRPRFSAAADPDAVILMRQAKLVPRLRQTFPRARLFLWLQCLPSPRYRRFRAPITDADCTVVAVSDFHRCRLERDFLGRVAHRLINRAMGRHPPRVVRIYDPIDDSLRPDATPVDPEKLVFFSSPHKGLDEVLRVFEAVRPHRPSARLYVANPGYRDDGCVEARGVVNLGSLPQAQVLRHVREAFCVFYPQTTFEETFGLIYAEANAVGTPVLAHPIGAAPEVLSNPEQLVDCSDPARVVETLTRWYIRGRPRIEHHDRYRLSSIVSQWENLLLDPGGTRRA
jgi:glycosyltransferase involved in cell wall biosynthesis